jgi:hypothetical protein
MIETHLEYLDKHITNSIEGSYKEWMIYRRLIRLKVVILVILVTDYPLENHADGRKVRDKVYHPQSPS